MAARPGRLWTRLPSAAHGGPPPDRGSLGSALPAAQKRLPPTWPPPTLRLAEANPRAGLHSPLPSGRDHSPHGEGGGKRLGPRARRFSEGGNRQERAGLGIASGAKTFRYFSQRRGFINRREAREGPPSFVSLGSTRAILFLEMEGAVLPRECHLRPQCVPRSWLHKSVLK